MLGLGFWESLDVVVAGLAALRLGLQSFGSGTLCWILRESKGRSGAAVIGSSGNHRRDKFMRK